MDDHQCSLEGFKGKGELAPRCTQIVLDTCAWPELEDLVLRRKRADPLLLL